MSRVTRREAKTLRERSSEMDREGGGLPLEEIERRMRVGMVQDLHRMARTYDGTPRKAKALLEAILTAEEEGLSAEVFAKVRREASEALRRRAA
jgi:chromosome segregation and condensation protein ScpB